MKTSKTSTALISVTDKSGLDTLAAALRGAGVRIIASSGTKAYLEGVGKSVNVSVHIERIRAVDPDLQTIYQPFTISVDKAWVGEEGIYFFSIP